jgi:hypothetical protein
MFALALVLGPRGLIARRRRRPSSTEQDGEDLAQAAALASAG